MGCSHGKLASLINSYGEIKGVLTDEDLTKITDSLSIEKEIVEVWKEELEHQNLVSPNA